MKAYEIQFQAYGDKALLITWPAEINEGILLDIRVFQAMIEQHLLHVECIPAYHSLTICFTDSIINFDRLINELKHLYQQIAAPENLAVNCWKIPVCYDSDFGIDQKELAQQTGVSIPELIRLHSQTKYTVYFIGFLPGFMYLGGLPKQLHCPRKAQPDLHIPAGSVAIGGSQTGVYPQESPGGWHVIGRSPLCFFDIHAEYPCFAKAGDQVLFYSISKADYYTLEAEVKSGNYKIVPSK